MAQESPRATISSIISTVNKFNNNRPVERLYLQTDKPVYATGDTMRFKGYLMQSPYWLAATKSGVLYLEIANDSNRVMKRLMLPVYQGLTYGNIALDKELPQGGYILRAYTNWMRNFGEDQIYKKAFYIGRAANNDWMVNYTPGITTTGGKETVKLNLQLNRFDMVPVALHEMQIRITDGRRTLFKQKADTDMEGRIAANFDLPEKANAAQLSLVVEDLRKGEGNRKLSMPIILNRPDHIDLQFMPEGGNLVAGLPAHVAFKAVNEDGRSTDIAGTIYNSKQQEVAGFAASHKGIGAFELLPEAGQAYSAKVKLPDGTYKTYSLPVVKSTGMVLKIDNPFKGDSVVATVYAPPDAAAQTGHYYLMGHARGMVFYGALLRFNKGIARLKIAKDVFPTGIARFTIIGDNKQSLNQRMIFIDRGDNLNIQYSTNKPVYKQRDSVALNITVTDNKGIPVQGSFSLAVTDDGQVKGDSISNGSILTHILLTADLKGMVEDPGYYSNSAADARKWQNLDQLLLAQGWVGFNWNDAFAPIKPMIYPAEAEFLITGHVTSAFNRPVANSGVMLFSKKPSILIDTVTNAQGVFTFKGVFPADTAVYFLQARNKKGKSSNVGIEMDEFKPPVFSAPNSRMVPWYMNIDTNRLAILKKQTALKVNMEKITRGTVLNEVVIKAKKFVKDSKNLNGPGEADVIIDEEELQKAGRTSLGDLLTKRVKGFGYQADKKGNLFYRIYGMKFHLIIDGMDTEFFHTEGTSLYQYFKEYLDYYDAEEIKGIEVMTGNGHQGRYKQEFLDPMAVPWDHAFVEVTTRSGHGPFVKKAVGTYVYRPMPFTVPKQFYAPKYISNSTPDMTDIRSTIHWEPNIVTDKNGKAIVSFYTADNTGTYTLIIEGMDLDGGMGNKRGSIAVKK
jgi:hypothetical protein